MKFTAPFLLFLFFYIAVSNAQIKVEKINENDLTKLIQNRNSKPLLINIWATWCIPCREEFPDLVKLANENNEKLDIVGISVDYPDEIDSKILPFLKKMKVNFDIYVNDIEQQEKFIDFFDKDWNGALPATFIYNSKGVLVQSIYGKQDYDYFNKAVKNLTDQ